MSAELNYYRKMSLEERRFLNSEELKQLADIETKWEYYTKKTNETYFKIKALENYLENNDPLSDDWSVHYETLQLAMEEQNKNGCKMHAAKGKFFELENLAQKRKWDAGKNNYCYF